MGGHTLLIGPDALASIYVLLQGGDVSAAQRAAVYSALHQARRPTVRWASRPGRHVIDGQAIDCSLVGLDAAFCAIHWPAQRHVRAADFASPGAEHPAEAVRGALRRAAAFLRPVHPGLAAAVATITVERGFVVYRPTGAIDIEPSTEK